MTWIDFAWPAMGGACLVLAAIHLMARLNRKAPLASLSFAFACLAVACVALLEFRLFHAPSVERYATWLRWSHVPNAVLVIAVVAYVRAQLRSGRLWLGVLACATRLASLLPDFLTGVNLNFREITALVPVRVFGGVELLAPVGSTNAWMALGQASVVLLLAFLLDTAVNAPGQAPLVERRRVQRICASLALFYLLADASIVLTATGVLGPMPAMFVPWFMSVVLVMSYDFAMDLRRVSELTKSLAGTEASLHDAELRFDHASRDAGIGLWSLDVAEAKVACSEQCLKLLGFAPGEAFDRELARARIPEEDQPLIEAAFLEASRGDGEYSCEYRLRDPVAGLRWLAAIGHIQFDAAGAPARMRGVIMDITRRRQADERFRRVVEASAAALLIVQADGRIVFANERTEQVFGYGCAELLELNVDALVPAASRGAHANARRAYSERAEPRQMGAGRDLFGLRKDGNQVPVEIGLCPIPHERETQYLAMIVDISERKRVERELSLQRDELAHLSRVALLSELSGSLAHELNQPLTAILSNAQAAARFLARSPPDLEEVRESLVNIIDSDKRAGEVIRRLRAMLRKEPAEFQPLDLNEVVSEVLTILRSDLVNRNVQVETALAAGLPPLMGDRVQLQQVLLNLISNGCDAMDAVEGVRRLSIQTRATAEGGLELQVRDLGRGIPEADLERIFSPFVTAKAEGMGLGLAVCTTIVDAHRGRLWASNNDGPGATMHLHLPRMNEGEES